MLFPKRQSYVNRYQGTAALGNSISFDITRDFFLDSLEIFIPVTVTIASNATLTAGGIWNVVKRIQLQVADGQSNRLQTDVSGFGCLRYAGKVLNGLDLQTLSANTPLIQSSNPTLTAIPFLLCYPLMFKHPQISDPIGSAFMLPLPRYNADPILTIQFGALSDVTTGEDTVTIGLPYIIVNKRQVDVITFPTWQTELIENTQSYSTTGANQLYEMQVPGSYSAFQIFGQNAQGTAQDISGGLPFVMQYLGNTLRQFTYANIKAEENYSQGNDGNFGAGALILGDYWPGLMHLDFLHDGFGMEVGELGSVLNANLLAGSGSRVQLLSNIASTGQYSYLWNRIFGDLTPLKLSTQVASN